MNALTGIVLGVLIGFALAGIVLAWPKRAHPERGQIVVERGHYCMPPSTHVWAGGERKVHNEEAYPEGTVWRCFCGLAWESTYGYRGLWLRWDRCREHDAPVALTDGARAPGVLEER